MHQIIDYLFEQYRDYQTLDIVLEIVAVIFGFMSVWYSKQNKILVFPTGMISTSIFVYLLFNWGLLGDMMINAYYFAMSVYGWYIWTRKIDASHVTPISRTNKLEKRQSLFIFLATIVFVYIVYYYNDKWTSWTAYVDTITTAVFFVGMWLMAKRKIENWIYWIIGDIISVPLYLYKRPGLYQFSIFRIHIYCNLWIYSMEKALEQLPINLVKIVLFGPESTGKTTMSELLAKHYNTVWVAEYAREYLQEKWNNERRTCEDADLIPIAKGQIALENKLALKADKVLICDTDLLETKVYSEEYYGGFVHPNLDKYALKNQYDLYLLTNIDTPWEADDLRDRPEQREEMYSAFEAALIKHNKPYIKLNGSIKNRLAVAISAIDKLLEKREDLNSYSKSL